MYVFVCGLLSWSRVQTTLNLDMFTVRLSSKQYSVGALRRNPGDKMVVAELLRWRSPMSFTLLAVLLAFHPVLDQTEDCFLLPSVLVLAASRCPCVYKLEN